MSSAQSNLLISVPIDLGSDSPIKNTFGLAGRVLRFSKVIGSMDQHLNPVVRRSSSENLEDVVHWMEVRQQNRELELPSSAGLEDHFVPDYSRDPFPSHPSWEDPYPSVLLRIVAKVLNREFWGYAGFLAKMASLSFSDLEQQTLRLLWAVLFSVSLDKEKPLSRDEVISLFDILPPILRSFSEPLCYLVVDIKFIAIRNHWNHTCTSKLDFIMNNLPPYLKYSFEEGHTSIESVEEVEDLVN